MNQEIGLHLNTLIREIANDLRAAADTVDSNSVFFRLDIDGRTHGELRVEITVGSNSYSDDRSRGSDYVACVREFMRRKGWEEQNRPLYIANYTESKTEPPLDPVPPAEPEPEPQPESEPESEPLPELSPEDDKDLPI